MTSVQEGSGAVVRTDPEAYPDRATCPTCGSVVPSGPLHTTWCEGCGWNVDGGVDPEPVARDPLARISRRVARAAAVRVLADLERDPEDTRPGRTRGVAVVLALAVLLAAALVFAGAVWWFAVSVWYFKVFPAALVLWMLWVVAPRPVRPGDDVVVLDPQEYPRTHDLVRELSEGMGVRPPARIWASTAFNANVRSDPWRRDAVLELGLPLWGSLEPDERQFVLGHELGHLRGRDTGPGAQLVWTARSLVGSAAELTWPTPATTYDLLLLLWVTDAVQRVLALPLIGAWALLEHVDGSASQRDEYLADRRAAALCGRAAAVRGLLALLGTPRGATAAGRAARSGGDVWEALHTAPRRPEREDARLVRLGEREVHVSGASHPPTHLRVRLARATAPTDARHRVHRRTWQDVDRELGRAREQLRNDFRDRLLPPG